MQAPTMYRDMDEKPWIDDFRAIILQARGGHELRAPLCPWSWSGHVPYITPPNCCVET